MGEDIGRLIYLGLLVAVIGGYFFVENRHQLGKMVRQAAVWGLIFVGVIAGIGLWGDIRSTVSPRQTVFAEAGRVEVPRAPDGHYYLTLGVNETPVFFMVDTGASDIVLTRKDAQRAGLDVGALRFLGEARTANGVVSTAPVRLERLSLAGAEDHDVRAVVNGGEMDISLLGMRYLQRFSSMEFRDNRLILTR